MINIESPFLTSIPSCKLNMRKLRKKIYKYTSTRQPTPKPKESVRGILTLLKSRNLPDFLIDILNKKRNFDFSHIQNVSVPMNSSLHDIQSMASKQEIQTRQLFLEHKTRLQKKPRKIKKRQSGDSENSDISGSEIHAQKQEILIQNESMEKLLDKFDDNFFNPNRLMEFHFGDLHSGSWLNFE